MKTAVRLMGLAMLLFAVACTPRSGSVMDQPGNIDSLTPIPWTGSTSIVEPPMAELTTTIGDSANDPAAAQAALLERIADAERSLGANHATTQRLQLMLAFVHEENGRFDDARSIYQRIASLNRTDTAAISQPLADALRAQAIMEAKAGDLAAAKPLIEEAIAIYDQRDRFGNTLRTSSRGAAGMIHAFAGELRVAIAHHDAAVKMLPSDPRVYRDRAVTLLIAGQWKAAREDLIKAFRFRQRPINDTIGLLWIGCAAAGDPAMGDDAMKQVFAQQSESAQPDVNERIGRYLNGELSQEQLLEAAASPYAWRDRYNRCLVAYYIAHRHRADGNDAGYQQWLTTCLNLNVRACWALHAARRETMNGG